MDHWTNLQKKIAIFSVLMSFSLAEGLSSIYAYPTLLNAYSSYEGKNSTDREEKESASTPSSPLSPSVTPRGRREPNEAAPWVQSPRHMRHPTIVTSPSNHSQNDATVGYLPRVDENEEDEDSPPTPPSTPIVHIADERRNALTPASYPAIQNTLRQWRISQLCNDPLPSKNSLMYPSKAPMDRGKLKINTTQFHEDNGMNPN